jgi:2-oxoglutarate ferredoxin oxidoreductase subunit alpha
MAPTPSAGIKSNGREVRERVTIRFAGDSGDGIQVMGGEFTNTTAIMGNDVVTFPNYPAEIRAPAGTLPGVSEFQINFSSTDIHTPGDQPDVLVVFNPAALAVNIADLPANGILIVNTDAFKEIDLKKAQCKTNPLEDGSLSKYQVFAVPITDLTMKALEEVDLPHKDKARCKNFFALGILYWLYDRPLENTMKFFEKKFGKKDARIVQANCLALKAGSVYGEASELFHEKYEVPPAEYEEGSYRNISGNEALALGLIAASKRANRPLYYGSYPITPASDVLHTLSRHKNFGVITFQAEDEIAAVSSAIGASYGGAIGVTGSSGPGIALKSEAINLAVMTELPLVILDVQRAGPSTGMPTKTEQGDLLQVMFGRNSDSSVVVVAPATPSECFELAFFAVRIALKYMCPVFVLSDGYLANGAEPWKLPDLDDLPEFEVKFRTNPDGFQPYDRNELTLGRPWAIPGTPGLEHRIGGIEKWNGSGNISYDPQNHDFMVRLRTAKVGRVVQDVPDLEVFGPDDAETLVLGWGSTYGAIRAGVQEAQQQGLSVARAHLRYLNPFPANLGTVLKKYGRVLIPEMNLGQLLFLIRSRFGVDARGLNKIEGKPFQVSEIVEALQEESL